LRNKDKHRRLTHFTFCAIYALSLSAGNKTRRFYRMVSRLPSTSLWRSGAGRAYLLAPQVISRQPVIVIDSQ
jgi:hypothetical protein